ncbi:ankyrin repeat domain-containing protein 12 [Salvelinus fontinalis]|uniref:ankyrin repeat domain-containing protein 12 n=1 Tax=Salvelinus fontinalis TaxID=8038 RepID=UPI0024863D5F|nr:ankyrin repeat domain-containing protein 12 [Salvelinus fontinalis]
MVKPGTDRDGAMVDKPTGKKSKDKISLFTKTPKLDRSEFLGGKEGKPPKSSMKRKLSFTVSPPRSKERESDTDESDPGQSTESWEESEGRLVTPCRMCSADKDGPDKKKVKKESGGSKKAPVNLLFGYPLSERKQMALLMQMTAMDNSPDSTPSHPSQALPVQKKLPSSTASRARDKVNKRNERGETPLHMAAIRGDAKHVKEIISLGADVNVKDFAGWTPLHEACNLGYYDVAKVLIAAGAEVNTQGLDDDTPLHDASSSGHTDIVKLLLRHGGNAFQANKRGERPVDIADSHELELLLKGEVPLSDPEDSSSESEDPPSVNPSSVDVDDDHMDDSDVEKVSEGKRSTVKASPSMSGLDEYEFKDEEEEDLSKALNDRHILRRELRQEEKDHLAVKQSGKGDGSGSVQSKKTKTSSRVLYCSSDSSSDEMEMPSERRSSPTCSHGSEGHKAPDASRTKKENLTTSEKKDKGSKVKKKNKSKSKNKENQEDGKENSKALVFSVATVSETHTDKNSRGLCGDEDSFKMSFSPKDDSSVHLFHLSATVKSPKLNHGLADKQPSSNPLKQENAKMTCVSIAEGPCPPDGVKYNHYNPESEFCTESSSSKGCKHKEKSKHHQNDVTVDAGGGAVGEDGGSSPYNKDGSVANSVDVTEGGALRKTDKDGKVVKKHKLKHKEKDKPRREYEPERNRHRQKEGSRKDGHRNLEFDREFWKENFFNDDEPLPPGKMEREDCGSPQNTSTSGSSPVKEERKETKEKHPSSISSKEKRPRREEERLKKERKEPSSVCKEERGGKDGKLSEREERTECLSSVRVSVPEETQHNSTSGKDEPEEKPVTGTTSTADSDQLDASEKCQRDKYDRRSSVKDREADKTDKKHPDKEKKVKIEHPEKSENSQNSMDRWKEREKERMASPGDKNHKEIEKLRALSATKKHEESKDKKSKDKPDKRSDRVREYNAGEHKDRTSSDKKGKPPLEKSMDHSKSDRSKEKENDKDCDKKKKEKSKDSSSSSSSSSNLKLLLEEKGYVSESGKTLPAKLLKTEDLLKTPEKDRRDRESRDSDRHRDRDKDRSKDRSKEGSKASKTKPNETEANRDNRSKAKASSATREEQKPKEKRLVNEDLRQTSFERMLSLKDQEIEQWHRKHLEKIKQKERERMKQRPSSTTTDPGKLKSKAKAKTTSSSSGEPCLSKELLRSKSSEGSSDVHCRDRDKPLKDSTSSRTMSLDGKTLSCLSGKLMAGMENSLSRSPRPESQRSGLMSRSVSMVSVASSEDSCQATLLTPRPIEYDSDMTLEPSQDFQLPFLLSSFLSYPAVHDNILLEEPGQDNQTPLQSRNASPCLRAILDEDANCATASEGRPFETLSKAAVVPAAQPSEEPTSVQPLETCADPEESQSQSDPIQMLPNLPNAITDADLNTESKGNTASGVYLPPQAYNTRDPHIKHSSTLQQASVPQLATPEQRGFSSTSDPLLIRDVQCIPVETSSAAPECSIKDLPSEDMTPLVTLSSLSCQLPFSRTETTSSLSASQLWEILPNTSMVTSQQMQTETDGDLALDPKDKTPVESAASSAESRAAVESLQSALGASRPEWMDNPVASTSASSEDSMMTTSKTKDSTMITSKTKDSPEEMDTDVNSEDCKKSRFSSDIVGPSDPQPDKNYHTSQLTSSTVSRCSSPEHKEEETSDAPDRILEKWSGPEAMSTEKASCWSSSEGSSMVTIPEVKAEPCQEPTSEERPEGQTPSIVGSDQTQSVSGQSSNFQQGSQTDQSVSSYSSSGVSASSSPQSGDRDSDSSGAKAKVLSLTMEEDQDFQQTHPRKKKMPRLSTSNQAGGSMQQESLASIVDSLKLEEIQPYQTERANPYYEFLHIRKKIEEKRKVLLSVIPQPPQYYDEYMTFTGSYLLDGNPLSKLCIPTITPPPSLPDQLKEMFKQQEVVRMKLRLQHSIEREKLIVSNEQEVLRVHYRAARTLANQTLPFSACTVLLDAEVYNMPQDAQSSGMMSRTVESGDQDGKTSVRGRFNARQFMSWLQDVDDKFDKLKTCLLMRQQHEAAALNAVQRLHWQLKLQELDPVMYKSTSIFEISEFYIPLVEVNDDFDLTPI